MQNAKLFIAAFLITFVISITGQTYLYSRTLSARLLTAVDDEETSFSENEAQDAQEILREAQGELRKLENIAKQNPRTLRGGLNELKQKLTIMERALSAGDYEAFSDTASEFAEQESEVEELLEAAAADEIIKNVQKQLKEKNAILKNKNIDSGVAGQLANLLSALEANYNEVSADPESKATLAEEMEAQLEELNELTKKITLESAIETKPEPKKIGPKKPEQKKIETKKQEPKKPASDKLRKFEPKKVEKKPAPSKTDFSKSSAKKLTPVIPTKKAPAKKK